MSKELFEYQKELDDLSANIIPKVGLELADKEQTYRWMLERKKSFLARIMENILHEGKVTHSRSETRALASKDYQDFMDAFRGAIKEYFDLKYRYETLLNRSTVLITFVSLEKEKMRIR